MLPAQIFSKASKEPRFLLKCYIEDMIKLVLIIAVLAYLRSTYGSYIVEFHLGHIGLFLLAIPFGWMIASFIHNTGHGNIRNQWLNKIIGEFCGHFVGYGYSNFILVHTLHHKYSDHEYDPVSPEGMSFIRFLISPTRYMIKHTKAYLRMKHGETKNYETILLIQTIVFYVNMILRQVFWCLLLGPSLYLAFYLPAVMSNILILAHINYVCHRDLDDGSVEIFNMNHNLYYKIANFITIGGYYHKNHHLSLGHFDPRDYEGVRSQRSLVTVEANPLMARRARNVRGSFLVRYFDLNNIWGQAR